MRGASMPRNRRVKGTERSEQPVSSAEFAATALHAAQQRPSWPHQQRSRGGVATRDHKDLGAEAIERRDRVSRERAHGKRQRGRPESTGLRPAQKAFLLKSRDRTESRGSKN